MRKNRRCTRGTVRLDHVLGPDSIPNSSRRQFAKGLTALAMAPVLGAKLREKLTSAPAPVMRPGRLTPQPTSGAIQEKTTEQNPKPSPEAEALAGLARMRYGKNLTEAQIAELTRGIDAGIKASAAMRKFKLSNGDEPAVAFTADLI